MSKLKHIPEVGKHFGNWEVVDSTIYRRTTNRESYWKVKCKCGSIETRAASHLVNGKTSSCRSCAATVNSFEQSYFNKIIERALKSNFEFNLTLEYLLSIFNSKCALSDLDIEFKKDWKGISEQTASLDRIDNTKGYILGNVQWVHKQVNFMKGTMKQEDFISFCKLISSKCG